MITNANESSDARLIIESTEESFSILLSQFLHFLLAQSHNHFHTVDKALWVSRLGEKYSSATFDLLREPAYV
jgi:hypothetical protein